MFVVCWFYANLQQVVNIKNQNMRKHLTLILAILFAFISTVKADEGMWIPGHISKMNYTDMQKLGLKLSPEEIYSINNSSLKDAIFQLIGEGGAGFCTGEIVSQKGLLFTNHHCGYEAIANLSSTESNYLDDGFWAKSLDEEIAVPGVSVSRVVRIENVTEKVLEGITFETPENEREKQVAERIAEIEKNAKEDTHYKAKVKEMYQGGEYYLFVHEVFGDVRFVGAPPSSIGKYGGDTDNWMWPRHTGDFSIFRVYMSPDGLPTDEYQEDNIPYKPLHHLPISIKGIEEGDFTMIMGYPGQTERYLSSWGMEYKMNYFDPIVVRLLGEKLKVMKSFMDKDDAIRLDLADTYASLANGHKMFKGEAENLRNTDAIQRREALQNEFAAWVESEEMNQKKYGDVLANLEENYTKFGPITESMIYASIGLIQASDHIMLAQQFKGLQKQLENKDDVSKSIERLKKTMPSNFESYYPQVDEEIMRTMLKTYAMDIAPENQIAFFTEILPNEFKGKTLDESIDKFVEEAYEESIFTSEERMNEFLEKPKAKHLAKDPFVILWDALISDLMGSQMEYLGIMETISLNERKFIAGLREFQPNEAFYPDANSTLRLTYGTVKDYDPRDAVHYHEFTYVEGILEKYVPGDDEFDLDPKLIDLIEKKDFGRYADETGSVPVCFISDNDITGGNSGSPILNGEGHLIGLAFDGNWEWLCSNLIYNPELQRTINVDSRYVLWVIEKFGGASNIIDELEIIE
jgi:hypothetical protein